MPSGAVHAQCSLVLTVPAAALAYGACTHLPAQTQFYSAVACGAGCLAGLILTPDLDQESISSSEYTLIKWTMGLGFLWAMLWYPYARLLKHRSPWSHFPLVGTAGRLLYLGIFVAIAMSFGWKPPSWPMQWVEWAVTGLAISDAAHWLLDTRFGDHLKHHSRH